METQVNQFETGYNANRQTAPVITLGEWMITLLLMLIPIVNIILLFVWAFGGGTNPTKSNYAKATLLWMLIAIVIYVVLFVLILGSLFSAMS
jgi:uncharacterized membrane protein YdjX (TVP38/TMEM64 family)